jgi:hypothetical protein
MENNVIVENDYLRAIMNAFGDFIQEEAAGNIYSELRLMKRIEAARQLYPQEKRLLSSFVRIDPKNDCILSYLQRNGETK